MPRLPVRLSQVAPSGGGRIPQTSPELAGAPARSRAQFFNTGSQLAFSFGEEQRKLNQFNETLELKNEFSRRSSDLIFESQSNPDFKNHEKRVSEGLEKIREEVLGRTEDAEVDLFLRRSFDPSVQKGIIDSRNFQLKKSIDVGKANITRDIENSAREAATLSGKELIEKIGSIRATINGARSLRILSAQEATELELNTIDDINQARAGRIITDNPEEYLKLDENGAFKFRNPKTRETLRSRAVERVHTLNVQRDKLEQRKLKEERRILKERQSFNSGLLLERHNEGSLSISEVNEAFRTRKIDEMDHRFLSALTIKQADAGGRGNAELFNRLKTQIALEGPIDPKAIAFQKGPGGLNSEQTLALIEESKAAEGEHVSKNPFFQEGRRSLTAAFGTLEQIAILPGNIKAKAESAHDEYIDIAKARKPDGSFVVPRNELPEVARKIRDKHGVSRIRYNSVKELKAAREAGIIQDPEVKRQIRLLRERNERLKAAKRAEEQEKAKPKSVFDNLFKALGGFGER